LSDLTAPEKASNRRAVLQPTGGNPTRPASRAYTKAEERARPR